MKKNILLFFSMIFCLQLVAHKLVMMPGYENQIVGADVYNHDKCLAEVRIKFSKVNPVCNYVPVSFDESNNSRMQRYFIPLNEIDKEGVEETLQQISEDCEDLGLTCQLSICDAPCHGIECLFIGEENIDVEKNIKGEILSFTVSKVKGKKRKRDWDQKDSMTRALSGKYFSLERSPKRRR